MDKKTSEMDIQFEILKLMQDRKVWTNASLKHCLGKVLNLTEADREVGERKNEALWENRVNNALGQARSSSLYAKGHVINAGHGEHQITEKGIKFINEDIKFDDLKDEMIRSLKKKQQK